MGVTVQMLTFRPGPITLQASTSANESKWDAFRASTYLFRCINGLCTSRTNWGPTKWMHNCEYRSLNLSLEFATK
jgi:hypothetical protein